MSFLTEPSIKYKDSYLEAVRELQGERRCLDEQISALSEHFDAYVQRVLQQKNPAKVTPGRVPNVDWWLVDNGEFIGRLNLRYDLDDDLLKFGGHIGYEIRPSKRRHGYGREILRFGLDQAKAIGLHRALVTCDETNIGSKKIIEYNGGQFENAVTVEGLPIKKLRYWIALD